MQVFHALVRKDQLDTACMVRRMGSPMAFCCLQAAVSVYMGGAAAVIDGHQGRYRLLHPNGFLVLQSCQQAVGLLL